MKIFIYTIILFNCFMLISCNDNHGHSGEYDYHAHIESPRDSVFNFGDTLHININFESHSGATVHHINVKIINKLSSIVIFDKPDMAHVHATNGKYLFHDKLILKDSSLFISGSEWSIIAKVWGEKNGEQEITETASFRIK
jgi:hypothetical protein